MAVPIPNIDVPVVDPQSGLMTQAWYVFMQAHQRLAQMPDVSTVAPTNGQVLIYNATTRLWTPGAN
jgi:hypothetical protein